MFLFYVVAGGLHVCGLLSVSAASDHVVTYVGHDAVISLNVSQAGGEFKVGVEVNNVTEYLFLTFNDTSIMRVNSSRTWYRDRYRVRGSITSSVFRLTLYNVTPEDAGIYECRKIDTTERVPGCEQLLIVAQNPSQPSITGPASTVSGGSVTLTCSSSSRSLPPDHPPLIMTYTWRRNTEEIQGGGDVPVDGPSLTVRHISREKDDIYTCQAVEEGLESDWSHGHVLDVQYGPNTVQFNGTDDTVTATEGDPLTVGCSADCNPACTVTWWDTSRQRGTSGQREAVLDIPAVIRSLSDLYTCHVNNTHGNKSRNLKLDIQYTKHPSLDPDDGVQVAIIVYSAAPALLVPAVVLLACLMRRCRRVRVLNRESCVSSPYATVHDKHVRLSYSSRRHAVKGTGESNGESCATSEPHYATCYDEDERSSRSSHGSDATADYGTLQSDECFHIYTALYHSKRN